MPPRYTLKHSNDQASPQTWNLSKTSIVYTTELTSTARVVQSLQRLPHSLWRLRSSGRPPTAGRMGCLAGIETCRRRSRGIRVADLSSRKNAAGGVVIESESLWRRRPSGWPSTAGRMGTDGCLTGSGICRRRPRGIRAADLATRQPAAGVVSTVCGL